MRKLVLLWIAMMPQLAGAQEDVATPKGYVPLLESGVARVLLYSDRALVTRTARDVPMAPGRALVAFEDLPGNLIDSSVRAALPPGSALKVATIEVEPLYKTTFRKEEAQEAVDRLAALQSKLKERAETRESVVKEEQFLGNLTTGRRPAGAPPRLEPLPFALDAWTKLLDFISSRRRAIADRERKLADEIDELNAEIVVASSRVKMLSSYKTLTTKRVVLEMECPAKMESDVEISYIVPGPSWFPRYDVRADLAKGSIELVEYALVKQETGEDWRGVVIEFSAAEPSRAADLPKLMSWRIGAAEEQPQMAVAKPGRPPKVSQMPAMQPMQEVQLVEAGVEGGVVGGVLGGVPAAEPALAPPPPMEAMKKAEMSAQSRRVQTEVSQIEQLYKAQQAAKERGDVNQFQTLNQSLQWELSKQDDNVQRAFGRLADEVQSNLAVAQRLKDAERLGRNLVPPVRSSGGYDYRYSARRVEDVPSDGALTKVVLGKWEFPAGFTYEVAPEKSRTAFLKTSLRNTTSSPFLAGPVSVFMASDFVGEAFMSTCAPTEQYTLGLGADEEIFVTRDVQKKRDTKGMFGSKYHYDVSVDVIVVNNKNRPVTISLFDRVPFTFDNEVKLKETSVDPAPAAREPKGLLRWDMDLAPKARQKISIAYSYEHDSERRVVLQEDYSVRW
ncbi:MAG: mucoidy inhibitor MuiA family protein [Acidobacteriota bacterium]